MAASTAAGAIAADLLDLDPEDFGPEIAEYVAGGGRPEDVDELARVHGRPRDPHLGALGRRLDGEDPEAPKRCRRRPRARRRAARPRTRPRTWSGCRRSSR